MPVRTAQRPALIPVVTPLLLLLLVVAGAYPARAQTRSDVEFELTAGVAVPLNSFLSTSSTDYQVEMKNSTGFALGIQLAFDDWEFRYALSALPTPDIRTQWSSTFVQRWNDGVTDAGLDELSVQSNRPDGGLEIKSDGAALLVHHVGLGYRIPLWRSSLHVFVPVGLGLAITTSQSELVSRPLYGLMLQTGVGLGWSVLPWMRVGGQLRYLVTFSENSADVAQAATIVNSRVTGEAVDSTYRIGHLLHLTASIAVEF